MTRFLERWIIEVFIAVLLVLVAFGVLMTYSSSVFYAKDVFGNWSYFFYRELVWVGMGVGAGMVTAVVHYTVVQRLAVPLLLCVTVLLGLVLVPGIGHQANHASRWLRVAGFTVQPSEMAKFAVIVFVAAYLAKYRRYAPRFVRGVLVPLCVVMMPTGLVLIEPDLGTPVVIVATVLVMLFVAGARTLHVAAIIASAIPAIALLIVKYPYRCQRLLVFLNPDNDPLGAAFQLWQSLIAVASGRMYGVGLGMSVQKLHYLPEAHTDFVFAIVGEELGFAGCSALIALFALLFWLIYRLTTQITDLFGHMVATGVMTMLALQTIVNIGVVTGCLPTKGIALPFISYGGSSLIMTLAACGLLVNIAYNQQRSAREAEPARSCGETIV